jgi:hypothetical protein
MTPLPAASFWIFRRSPMFVGIGAYYDADTQARKRNTA